MLIVADNLILIRLFFWKPWQAAINLLAVFSVWSTVEFGEPFFLSMLHKNSEISPVNEEEQKCEDKRAGAEERARTEEKPGGVDRVAHNCIDAGSEESVFLNGFGDFDFDGKDIDNKTKQNDEYAEDGEKN